MAPQGSGHSIDASVPASTVGSLARAPQLRRTFQNLTKPFSRSVMFLRYAVA